jgi:hypothetical protein
LIGSDPQVQKDFVDALYDEGPFMQCLPKALSDDGILVAQVGQAPDFSSSAEDFSINKNRVKFFESLVNVGFEHIRDYEEVRGGTSRESLAVVDRQCCKSNSLSFDVGSLRL